MTRKKNDNLEKDIKDIFNIHSDKNGFITDKHDDFEEPNFIEDSFDDDDDIVKLKKDDLVSVFSNHTKNQINEYIKDQKSYYSDYRRDKNITFDELKKEILIRYFYDNYVKKKTMNDRIENLFESIESNKDLIKFISITSLISINLLASLKFLLKRK